MGKTLLYARVSTGNQQTGLEAQILALKRYCKGQGIGLYHLFIDERISGAKTSRPALDALLKEVSKGESSQVITYSLSRLSRSTSHLLRTLEYLEQMHVRFISVTEAIDLATPAGRLLMTVLGAVGEMERSLVVERVKCGLENARAKGKRLGAPKKRNSELIRELARQGMSYRMIAKLAKCSLWSVCEEMKSVRCPEIPAAGVNHDDEV